MADDITRYGGTSKAYKPDAGGAPIDPGPHIGIVKNTVYTVAALFVDEGHAIQVPMYIVP